MKVKVGKCVKFMGLGMMCYGYIIKIIEEKNEVIYIRDNLRVWSVTKSFVEEGEIITWSDFVDRSTALAENQNKIPLKENEIMTIIKNVSREFE